MPGDPSKEAASLYVEHSTSLKRYALRLVPRSDVSHAEDAVQETFARTVKHLRNGNSVESPKGFLFRTLRNLVYNMFYRTERSYETNDMPDMDEFEADAYTCSPERRALAQQQLDAFSSAIAQLPDTYREAFVMRRVYGKSCREIAEVLGRSEDVVRVTLHRARLRVRALLEGYACEEAER